LIQESPDQHTGTPVIHNHSVKPRQAQGRAAARPYDVVAGRE